MSNVEALTIMRDEFAISNAAIKRTLRNNHVPLYSYKCEGWAYYADTDTVVYDGHHTGGN